LHSVTEENGQLTKRFTDAADAVLWLTPSTSPGQVAELDELSHELKNGKPLLPVITASDIREEDEVDGELVDCYVNKPMCVREDQQRDVLNRSKQKLDVMGATAELENPISISVFMYRKQDSTAQGIIDSGLSELTREMAALIQRAAVYKKSKVRQQTLNYLNDHVLQVVDTGLLPVVQNYSEVISDCRIQADRAVNDTIAMIKHSLGILVPKWAEEYKDSKNAEEVARLVNNEFHQIITRELTKVISDFSNSVKTIHQAFPADGLADFQDISIEYDEVTGSALAASAGVAGGLAGAAIGTAIMPGLGTVVGSILGGLVGSKAGEYLIETKRVSAVVGVDSAAFVKDVLDQVEAKAETLVPDVFSQWFEAIDAMQASVDGIRAEIRSLEESIKNIRVKD
jgi:outer membrane lipoprotein SlyB